MNQADRDRLIAREGPAPTPEQARRMDERFFQALDEEERQWERRRRPRPRWKQPVAIAASAAALVALSTAGTAVWVASRPGDDEVKDGRRAGSPTMITTETEDAGAPAPTEAPRRPKR